MTEQPFLRTTLAAQRAYLLASGMDSTDDFNAIHSAKAKTMVEDYYIGDLDDSAPGLSLLVPSIPAI